ncbi:hypothetical protein F5Y08DRAFT_257320 [Xylaria arbuscula]|nr:hypothetical protein F5Y08DRAFT_257320 [Xylaria arbuscula]
MHLFVLGFGHIFLACCCLPIYGSNERLSGLRSRGLNELLWRQLDSLTPEIMHRVETILPAVITPIVSENALSARNSCPIFQGCILYYPFTKLGKKK